MLNYLNFNIKVNNTDMGTSSRYVQISYTTEGKIINPPVKFLFF